MPVKQSQPARVKRHGTGRKYTGKPVTKPETAPVGDETIQGDIPIHACKNTYVASLIMMHSSRHACGLGRQLSAFTPCVNPDRDMAPQHWYLMSNQRLVASVVNDVAV